MMKLLDGKRGIIFGALDANSIAWKTALACHDHGACFVLTNAPVALRMGTIQELAQQTNARVIGADATNLDDLKHLIQEAQTILGGKIDFILHSIGMSPNVRKGKPYTDLNYSWNNQTLDISALSLHKVLQTCWELDALAEGASVVSLSYIAAQKAFPGYGDMADAKALLESITRSFGYYYGNRNKVRINTVSQSPTKTTAGTGIKGFDSFYGFADKVSPLGNAPAEDCAHFCVALFSDLTRFVTMQNLYHDGGFSNTGVSETVMEILQQNNTLPKE